MDQYNTLKSFINRFGALLITIFGVVVIFIISSLEGTKEIKAPNSISSKIIADYRKESDKLFPEERVDIFRYKYRDKEYDYYFVVKSRLDNGEIDKWYFAYEGGIDYIFYDEKFYILTLFTLIIALAVSDINTKSTLRKSYESESFKQTLKYYKEQKDRIKEYNQYLPDFCMYKNKQAYENKKIEIVEEAGIDYKLYTSESFDEKELSKWQLKKLEQIKKIKIEKLYSQDLLQEQGTISKTVIMLPKSEKDYMRKGYITKIFSKLITSGLSGLTVMFGVVLGNWTVGITYGLSIVMSAIMAIFSTTDYSLTTLRNRYIAKADYLNEFYNIKDKFIKNVSLEVKEKSDII